jgi:hypothetical protein
VNSKGQAFSVFKILIAGIVALAILGILLPLLGGIATPQSDPVNIAQTLVKNNYANKFTLQKSTQEIVFKQDDELSSRGIVEKVPALLPEQVCVLPGTYDSFFDSTGSLLTYKSSSPQSFKLVVYCGTSHTIQDDLDERSLEVANQLGDCPFSEFLEDEVACVVFPAKR